MKNLGALLLLLGCAGLVQNEPKQPGPQEKLPPSERKGAKAFAPLTKEQEEKLEKERQNYYVAPVQSEPALPSPDEAKEQKLQELPGGGYLHVTQDLQRVVIPSVVNLSSGMMEVFATLGPKDHEAVLRLFCNIHCLDLALSWKMGLKRGDYPALYGAPDPTDESRVLAFVQWKTPDGKTVTHRGEDLLIDMKRHRTFPRVGWMYLGGWHEAEDPRTKKIVKRLRAEMSKLVITTFRDPYSLIDNTLKAEDARDTDYAANHFVVPDVGSQVLTFFRKPTADELKRIKELEKKIYP